MHSIVRLTVLGLALAAVVATTPSCGVRTGVSVNGKNVTLHGTGPAAIGSGTPATEVREVGAFHAVDLEHAFDVTIEVGGETSVEIAGDDNLLSLVNAEVREGRLVLEVTGSYETELGLSARIVTPSLDDLELSGGCKAAVRGVETDRLEVDLSGASEATIVGKIVALDLETSGATKAHVTGVTAGPVQADLSGASSATVVGEANGLVLECSGSAAFVLTTLKDGVVGIDLSGASSATLSGAAKTVDLEASGSSSADLAALTATDVRVDVSGSADAKVSLSGALTGEASGSSSVEYTGSPASVSVETSRTSSVAPK